MALPFGSNTTADVYRNGNGPPASPDVPGLTLFLVPDWQRGQRADRGNNAATWTHYALMDYVWDVRDNYTGTEGFGGANQDSLYLPDRGGVQYRVVFVEVVDFGKASMHKRVFLDRTTIPTNWPTDEY